MNCRHIVLYLKLSFNRRSLPAPATASTPAPLPIGWLDEFKKNHQQVMGEVAQLKTDISVYKMSNDDLGERYRDNTSHNNMATLFRQLISCKVCFSTPKKEDTVLAGACCGNILGCGSCVTRYYETEQNTCIVCRNPEADTKCIILKGLDEMRNLLD